MGTEPFTMMLESSLCVATHFATGLKSFLASNFLMQIPSRDLICMPWKQLCREL